MSTTIDPLGLITGPSISVKGVSVGQAVLAGVGIIGAVSTSIAHSENARAEKEARMDHAIDVWIQTSEPKISARDHVTNYRTDSSYRRDFDLHLRTRNLNPEEYRNRLLTGQ